MQLLALYRKVRSHSEFICKPLNIEDYVPQPTMDVSPPRWHLAHTTWFFETFILSKTVEGYREFNPVYNYFFNSYYENVGERVARADRGFMTRPTVKEIYEYRTYVDSHMEILLNESTLSDDLEKLVVLGINHEQQHQELLWTDIKYILGHQPLSPEYSSTPPLASSKIKGTTWIETAAGNYTIGFTDSGFCFDNELGVHEVHLPTFHLRAELVSNQEYQEFIEDGGYSNVNLWHSEAWGWIQEHKISAPLYWKKKGNGWASYDLSGLHPLPQDEPVCHVNYYEASAFAEWKGCRLPTESEWEVTADRIQWGDRWEWTNSAYLAYPGYEKAPGAIGEYNGKFMVSQMVLRGASVATPAGHSRKTYRNFWHPWIQFQFTGIRLAE